MTKQDVTQQDDSNVTSDDSARRRLEDALLPEDPTSSLWSFVDTGDADDVVPELPGLRLEQDPIHRHKDVLAHTIAVTAKTTPRLVIRLAALFHDIGKPATRSFEHGGVTFRHHEAVGAKMTKRRLRQLGFEDQLVRDVAELVRLSGRFKGYADGWSDSAVRRYARDAGHLLGDLNELVRCDCTTRNKNKAAQLQRSIDDLERRITILAEEDRRARERPAIDGRAVMEILDIPGGRDIGRALDHLLELRRQGEAQTPEDAEAALRAWWAQEQGD